MQRFLISFLILFFVSLVGIHSSLIAQGIEEEWVARYHFDGTDEATAIVVDNSGNVYVTGNSHRVVDEVLISEYTTIKYNTSGTQEWVARYSGTTPRNSFATAIALDNSGNVYVTGRSTGTGTGLDYATVKYTSSGNEEWVARYHFDGTDEATAIVVDNSGNVYVTGNSHRVVDEVLIS
ncbi:MAG: SBBP repeat-containing protein, partial [Ignavibacteriaceae bacterium]|nr:SBBP repeat-containing protein [Ignavibacteriaceae bacterium]